MSGFKCSYCGNDKEFKITLGYRYASGVIDSCVECLKCNKKGPAMIWPQFVEYPMFEKVEK